MAPAASKRGKTSRFPATRIKKIMQADEDVGKLASATPVMISKSLECFLQLLVDESAKEARSKGSKKIAAHHVKHTVNGDTMFDFLLGIVSKVPEPSAAESAFGEGSGSGSGAGTGNGAGAGPSRSRKPTSEGASGPGGMGATRGRKRKTAPVPPTSEGHNHSPAFGRAAPRSASGSAATLDAGVKHEYELESINPTPRSMINLLNPSPGDPSGSGGPRFPGMGPDTTTGTKAERSSAWTAGTSGGVKEEPEEDDSMDGRSRGVSRERDTASATARDRKPDLVDTPNQADSPTSTARKEPEQKGMFDDYDDEDDY